MLDPVPQVEVDPHWPWLASLNELGPSVDCYPLSQEKQGEVCGSFQHPRGTLTQPPLGKSVHLWRYMLAGAGQGMPSWKLPWLLP